MFSVKRITSRTGRRILKLEKPRLQFLSRWPSQGRRRRHRADRTLCMCYRLSEHRLPLWPYKRERLQWSFAPKAPPSSPGIALRCLNRGGFGRQRKYIFIRRSTGSPLRWSKSRPQTAVAHAIGHSTGARTMNHGATVAQGSCVWSDIPGVMGVHGWLLRSMRTGKLLARHTAYRTRRVDRAGFQTALRRRIKARTPRSLNLPPQASAVGGGASWDGLHSTPAQFALQPASAIRPWNHQAAPATITGGAIFLATPAAVRRTGFLSILRLT